MTDLRMKALELAHNAGEKPDVVVKRAEAYLTFLAASTALTAPTPTASPLAEPQGTDPARLDDPKVVAETEKVVTERPTVSGDDTASTTSSSADAGSASQPAPRTEDAPSAEPSTPSQSTTPPVAEVNAAVLAFNRANGREKTLALLGKFGGSKVPEIDVSKHAELLAELKAGV